MKKRIFAWVAAAALASGILVGSNLIAQTQRDKAALCRSWSSQNYVFSLARSGSGTTSLQVGACGVSSGDWQQQRSALQHPNRSP